jgi:hypothetical protein
MGIGQIGIADIQIDVSSRDDIPGTVLGLQHIYTTLPLRDAVFKILEEVAPNWTTMKRKSFPSTKAVRAWINGRFWFWAPCV